MCIRDRVKDSDVNAKGEANNGAAKDSEKQRRDSDLNTEIETKNGANQPK